MNQDLNENDFYEYIEKLKEIYDENPRKATKEAKDSLARLSSNSKKKLLNDKEKMKFYIVMLYIVLALLGLFNISSYPLYIFGLIFFAAGSLIGLHVKGGGIVFLFSHGGTGFGLIIASLIGGLFTSPLMSDLPTIYYIYLVIMAIMTFIAIITTILYNLSDELSERKNFIFIPLVLFSAVIIMALILSKIILYKYNIPTSVFDIV